MSEMTTETAEPRRHMPGCILDPDHGAGCVRQQWATSDPDAPWNVSSPSAKGADDA